MVDQNGIEEILHPELRVKVLPSPNLLDVNLSTPEMDCLLFSPDGKMEPIRQQLEYYYEGCRGQFIDQVLGFYKVVEETGQATEKERTLRHLFSHSKLSKPQTVQAARKYFGSEDLRSVGMSKIEAARDELESHARKILSEKVGISSHPTKFYQVK